MTATARTTKSRRRRATAERKVSALSPLNPKQVAASELLADRTKKYCKMYGSSRSGKTVLAIRFIRARAIKYPGSKHLVARYSFANAKKTVWLQTMLPIFEADEKAGICRIVRAEGLVRYLNGSIVLLGGLEPSRISSVLAAEYGTIFITEANENAWDVIETLMYSRLNDTAKDSEGNSIPLKFLIDLNPTIDRHWSHQVWMLGIHPESRQPVENFREFAHIHFHVKDNAANLADGYVESLASQGPAKKKRYYDGEYGSYEGLVLPVVDKIHVVDDFEVPQHWMRGRAIDFGYVHPFVCLWGAKDPSNEVVYVYAEHVQSKATVRKHSMSIKARGVSMDLTKEQRAAAGREAWREAERRYRFTVADHDAEDRATLEEHGISTDPANKEVLAGIDHLIDLFGSVEDKVPARVKVFRSCSKLIDGIYRYRWRPDPASNDKRAGDREVVKKDDDEVDALRYLMAAFFPIVDQSPSVNFGPGARAKGATVTDAKPASSGMDVRRRRLARLGVKR